VTEAGRLHPLTLVFEALRVGRTFLLPALVGGASAARDDFGRMFGWFLAFLTIPALIGAVAKYVSFRYRLNPDEFVLDSGVLSRSRRVIPLSRIQNIDLQQGALQRLCGVAELRVETAGGNQTEAVLTVLSVPAAEALRAELLARRRAAEPTEIASEPETTRLARLGVGELALAGATANEVGLVAALLGGAFNLVLQLPIPLPEPDLDLEPMLPESPALALAVGIAVLVLVFLVLGWIFSVVSAVVRYYGFTLERTEKELRKQYGLLTRRQAFVPLRRIQTVRVEESLLRRKLERATLTIETAGSAPGERQRGGAEAFVPLTRCRDVAGLIAALFPDFDYDALEFHPVHPRSRRRGFIRYAVPIILAAAVLALVRGTDWLWLVGLLPLAWLAAHLQYRHRAYALAPGYVIARSGFLNRITWVVPEWKIQTLHVAQTPFQRRHGLASLIVDTAAGQATVMDLHQDDAAALLTRIAERVVHRREPAVPAGGA
jgi:putative membrane protein